MPLLCGQIETDFSRSLLLRGLIRHGMVGETRESSHYREGHYIQIHLDSDITIERIEQNEFLIRGDADDPSTLKRDSEALSLSLAKIGLRHRLEIYDDEHQLIGYSHWNWPLETPAPSDTAI